jgi:hypothetical protein
MGDHTVKLWDLGSSESSRTRGVLATETLSPAFNQIGQLLMTTSCDDKLRLLYPRTGEAAIRVPEGHGGTKGARARSGWETAPTATTSDRLAWLRTPTAHPITSAPASLQCSGHFL